MSRRYHERDKRQQFLFDNHEPTFALLRYEESPQQKQIREGREFWERAHPWYLKRIGEVRFLVSTATYVNDSFVFGERVAEGHINGIAWDGDIIILERNPQFGPKDKRRFLCTYWIRPEQVTERFDVKANDWKPISAFANISSHFSEDQQETHATSDPEATDV